MKNKTNKKNDSQKGIRHVGMTEQQLLKKCGIPDLIDDLLTQDEVKEAINTLIERRADITDLVYVYRDRQGVIHVNSGEPEEIAVFLLRKAEYIMLSPDTEEE